MKPATFAPAYIGLYPVLCDVARDNGYALAVHGTVGTDLDLVAIPWTKEAAPLYTLLAELVNAVEFTRDKQITWQQLVEPPFREDKPYGRQAFCIPLQAGAALLISIMRRALN